MEYHRNQFSEHRYFSSSYKLCALKGAEAWHLGSNQKTFRRDIHLSNEVVGTNWFKISQSTSRNLTLKTHGICSI